MRWQQPDATTLNNNISIIAKFRLYPSPFMGNFGKTNQPIYYSNCLACCSKIRNVIFYLSFYRLKNLFFKINECMLCLEYLKLKRLQSFHSVTLAIYQALLLNIIIRNESDAYW